ncbi:hypothetical protein OG625_25815 [Streptomyces sp. NBC_01351]|uniref:hypothetical protein n=1 Tax=Streptomyces sp. NBC_01351 TaxID=2903833 RepID=UPI002E3771E3|nr:hypothetical protein [Streptomyces sp. NBC_01351]
MNEITPQPAGAPAAAPAPAPAPAKSKRALKTVGTVLAFAAGAFAVKFALGAVGGPDDAGTYELVPPATFQGLTLQDSGPRVDAIKQGQGAEKTGTKNVAVVYADQAGTAQLVVSGTAAAFGDEDPGAELTKGLISMGVKDSEITTHDAGKPAGGAMRCGTLTMDAASLPLCMWGDHSSLVTVTVPVENKPLTIEELAARARELRAVMEVPAK